MESAYRLQCRYYADSVEEAYILMECLLNSHSFVYDNKRTVFSAFDVFLRINGFSKAIHFDHVMDRASSLHAITEYDTRHSTMRSGVTQ